MRPQLPVIGRWLRIRWPRLASVGAAMTLAAGLAGYAAYGAAAGTGTPAGSPGAHLDVGADSAAALGAADAGLAGPGGSTTLVAQPQFPPRSTVTLITGNRLNVDAAPGGALAITPVPTPGVPAASGPFVRFSWAGDEYVVPAVAARYLGSLLDPRLFDVSYLIRAKLYDGHSPALPVQVTHRSRAVPSLPGLHVTGGSGDTASGTLSRVQAPTLGRLLARGWHPGGRPPFPAGTWIGLARPQGGPPLPPMPSQSLAQTAGYGPAAPAQAAYPAGSTAQGGAAGAGPYHRLTVNFTGASGQPIAAVGFVQNVDDALHGGITLSVESSPLDSVSFSVPPGTYSLEFVIVTAAPGNLFSMVGKLLAQPQVTVDSNQTITLDARAAVPYRPVLHPAAGSLPPDRVDALGFTRSSVTGGGLNGGFWAQPLGLVSVSGDGFTGATLSATPTATVTTGTLGFDAMSFYADNISNNCCQSPQPSYLLDFPSRDRIPSSLAYTVGSARLTTVHEQPYYAPSGGDTGPLLLWEFAYHPWEGDIGSTALSADSTDITVLDGGIAVPAGDRTDYVYSSDPQLDTWVLGFTPSNSDGSFHLDVPRTLYPGEQVAETWDKGPMVPSPAAPTVTNFIFGGSPVTAVCPACRQDDNGTIVLAPYGDSDPGHTGQFSLTETLELPSFTFYRNGTPVLSSTEFEGLYRDQPLMLPLLPQAATYRLDWTLARFSDPAATTETDWNFHSGPSDPAANLPASEQCLPDTTRGCSFLPLLFLTYDLALNPDSQAAAGQPLQISFTARHQENEAPPTGVTATVSASFDNGQTWTTPQHATSQGNDQFTATITQPSLSATSGFVSLRVTATDGAGNSVTQTVIKAYGLTS